ncbi:replicative DNA helicase [candidate division GN15 bacterium]|nr:replicative DNA helicase [candidate division GN15 bacterium]
MATRAQTDKDVSRLQPPQSLDAEQSVLGAVLKDPEAVNRAVELLDSDSYFYSPRHQIIYKAVLELYNRNEPCDITTITHELTRHGQLDKIGGRVYLVELVEGVVSVSNVEAHASIVLEKSVLRRLIQASSDIMQRCYNGEQAVDDLLDEAEAGIFTISESRLRQGFVAIEGPVHEVWREVENPDLARSALSTGYHELDRLTDGLRNGDLVVVAGRPSMGKTAFALNIAEHVAIESKKGIGIFSIEMSREQLVTRMLCGRAGVNQQKVRSQRLSDPEKRKLAMTAAKLSESPIFIDDSPLLSALEMRAKARRLKAQQDVGLIIVDYIQMMHASGRLENRQQEIAQISRSMKSLAKELNVPVIAISQLSRMVEQRGGDKRPQLADLRESGAIEQDADVVMFVYRPEFYLSHLEKTDPKYMEVEGKAEIIVAKQRNGPTGVVQLSFRKELARFGNLERGHRELPPGAIPVDRGEGDDSDAGPNVPF